LEQFIADVKEIKVNIKIQLIEPILKQSQCKDYLDHTLKIDKNEQSNNKSVSIQDKEDDEDQDEDEDDNVIKYREMSKKLIKYLEDLSTQSPGAMKEFVNFIFNNK